MAVKKRVIDYSATHKLPWEPEIRQEYRGITLGERRREILTIYLPDQKTDRLRTGTVIYLAKHFYVMLFKNGIRETYYYHKENPNAPMGIVGNREAGKSLGERRTFKGYINDEYVQP